MKGIDKLGWICINDQSQLLVARSKNKTTYYIPGGKREAGESDQDALMREIKEELAVDLVPTSLEYMETFTAPAHDKQDVMVKMTCYRGVYTGEIKASAEIEEVRFIQYADKAICSEVTIIVVDWLKSKNLIS